MKKIIDIFKSSQIERIIIKYPLPLINNESANIPYISVYYPQVKTCCSIKLSL
jgi:hypothetical protein